MAVLLPVVICTAIVDTDELSYFRIKVIINTYSSYTMTLMMCGAKSVKSKGIVTPNTSRDCRYPYCHSCRHDNHCDGCSAIQCICFHGICLLLLELKCLRSSTSCFSFLSFTRYPNEATISSSIIILIRPLSSSSFTGVPSGENMPVVLANTNIPTNKAFPAIPIP